MLFKQVFVSMFMVFCTPWFAWGVDKDQSIEVNSTGIVITDNNLETYSTSFIEPITEYLVAAFATIPNKTAYIERVEIITTENPVGVRKVRILNVDDAEGKYLLIHHTNGINDVKIGAYANSTFIGTITLSAGAGPNEKLQFDYQAGLLLKWLLNSSVADASFHTITIVGNTVKIMGACK